MKKIKHSNNMNCKAIMHVKKSAGVIALILFAVFTTTAQTRTLSLNEAVQLGIQNSKQLKRSQYKINEALARMDQTKDAYLPSATVGFQYLHALMMTRTVNILVLQSFRPLARPACASTTSAAAKNLRANLGATLAISRNLGRENSQC